PRRHRPGPYRRRVGLALATATLRRHRPRHPGPMNIEANRQTRQTIVRLLSSMASAKEISQYLKRFSQLDAKRFAVVKDGGAVLSDALEGLGESLSFMQPGGMTRIGLHGAGRQVYATLEAAGIGKKPVNRVRVTTHGALPIVRGVLQWSNLALAEA